MRRQHNALSYRLELLVIRVRDALRPPAAILRACGVKPGMAVLDYGCGPGGFSTAAAEIVGPAGRVYALDVRPEALKVVRRAAARRRLENVETVPSREIHRLPPATMDVVLLYDVLHVDPEASAMNDIQRRAHAMLKADGVLSVRDHHIRGARLPAIVTGTGLFRLLESTSVCSQFRRSEPSGGTR